MSSGISRIRHGGQRTRLSFADKATAPQAFYILIGRQSWINLKKLYLSIDSRPQPHGSQDQIATVFLFDLHDRLSAFPRHPRTGCLGLLLRQTRQGNCPHYHVAQGENEVHVVLDWLVVIPRSSAALQQGAMV